LDKPEDSSGLTAVGARLYDAVLGAFISVDPVMDLADPQQWNAYVYANNNPMTFSDPTGLLLGPLIDGAYTAPTRGKPGSGGWQVGPNNTGYTGSWNNGGAGKWARPGTTYTPPVTIRRDPAADEARAQAAAAAKAKAQAEARARAAAEQRAREHAAAEAAHKKQAGIGQQVGGWLSGFGDAVGNVAEAAWDWSGQAAEQLTESKIGKSIEFACGFAFGAVATLCGAVYTAAYARQGKWDKAAVSAVGMIGGGAAGNAVAKNVVKRFANDLPGTPALSDARSISAVGDTLGVSDARRLYGMSYATSNVAGTATTLALSSAGNGIIGQD
ncbi:RHS repeat-associated core domain-containing protein, partial [Promicromonospora iranensis]